MFIVLAASCWDHVSHNMCMSDAEAMLQSLNLAIMAHLFVEIQFILVR